MVRAWYMDDSDEDQRLSHQRDPAEFVTLDELKKLGVEYWYFDPSLVDQDVLYLSEFKLKRGYTYEDQIEVSPSTLENYEDKIKSFYDEHIHKDDEIRYVLDGSGYFDVRDSDDKWIRIEVVKGDMISLPAGIFHRFTLDDKNFIRAKRLFIGEPIWTPFSRSNLDTNEHSVLDYKRTYINKSIEMEKVG